MTYQSFLESKVAVARETGFDIDPEEINPALMPHQRDTVVWALKGGRRAVFCKFGLGKTVIGLEFAYPVNYSEAIEVAIEALEKQIPKKPREAVQSGFFCALRAVKQSR